MFLGNAVCAREVLANQLCNVQDKRSGSQQGIQGGSKHLWGKRWQDLRSASELLTLTSLASPPASTPLPPDTDKAVQLKEFTCCLNQRNGQTKTAASKQGEEETMGCQLLMNKFSLDCF